MADISDSKVLGIKQAAWYIEMIPATGRNTLPAKVSFEAALTNNED